MKKKLLCIGMTLAISLTILCTSVFAADSTMRVDPTPYADSLSAKSSIVVTGSDVWLETRNNGGEKEYRAKGYVIADQYHWAQARYVTNFGVNNGEKNWGYGQVDSTTSWTHFDRGTAKIYYGN